MQTRSFDKLQVIEVNMDVYETMKALLGQLSDLDIRLLRVFYCGGGEWRTQRCRDGTQYWSLNN
ncbi:hypothetical protein P4S72_08085 [Vibrio sp. PP-XX7]